MSSSDTSGPQRCDFITDKAHRRLKLLESLSDDDEVMPMAIDSFLSAVVEAYGSIGELTSADKQQVSTKLSAIREMCVKCNHEMKGGAFDGSQWRGTPKAVFDSLCQTINKARRTQIMRQLEMCEHNLSGISNCKLTEIVLIDFRRLLGNTACLLELLFKNIGLGTLQGQEIRDSFFLCAMQLRKCFPLLLGIMEKSDHFSGHSIEAKEYLAQRMKVCLHKMRLLIQEGLSEEADVDLGGGLFILHMDQALSLLAMFDTKSIQQPVCSKWRDVVKTVLQHAMIIAQVASDFDFKLIHGSGEKILRVSGQLSHESMAANINPSMCKLYANSLSNALEEMEQRVCTAVLRMYLQVFSDPYTPLHELCLQCWKEPVTGEDRKVEDLTNLVAALDTHTDCIIQVALFAIACSNDEKRVLGIQSCLASLESLETQLVPALTCLYLRQSAPKWPLVSMLTEHWNSEVKELRKLIDGIIDPAALTQVTRDAVWVPAAVLKKVFLKKKAISSEELVGFVRNIVRTVSVLTSQLQLTFEELQLATHEALSQAMRDLLLAVREGEALFQILQREPSSITLDRILKRCELMVSCVERIQPLLEELEDASAPATNLPDRAVISITDKSSKKSVKRTKQYSRLGLGLPSDIDIEMDVSDTYIGQSGGLSFSIKPPIQTKFTTSILYKSRQSQRAQLNAVSFRGSARSSLFSRKRHVGTSPELMQQTLCLDVTDILEGLANLSQTIRSQSGCVSSPTKSARKLYATQLSDSNIQEPPQVSSCSSFDTEDISTPERIGDLLHVQNRIESVRLSSHCSNAPSTL